MVKRKKDNKRQKSTKLHAASSSPPFINFLTGAIFPLVFLVGPWTNPLLTSPTIIKAFTAQVYLSGLIAYWFWKQRNSKKDSLIFSLPTALFAALFLLGTTSILWAVNTDFFVYKWLMWYCAAIMFFLGLQIEQTDRNLSIIFNCVIAAAVSISIIGILQYLFSLNILPQNTPPAATFGNVNFASQVMVLTLPIPLYFLFKADLSRRAAWGYALSTCLILTFLFYARTRAVWVACSLGILFIVLVAIFDRPERNKWLVWNTDKTFACLFAALIFFCLINLTKDGFHPFSTTIAGEVSSIFSEVQRTDKGNIAGRYVLWGSTLEMIRQSPIVGTGLGSFFENFNNGGYSSNTGSMGTQRAHNDVLELGVELGATGWLLFSGILVSICMSLITLAKHSSGQQRLIYILLTAAAISSLSNATLSFPYQLPVPLVLVSLFVAILVRGSEQLEQEPMIINFKVGRWYSKAALAICGLLFFLVTIVNTQWVRASNDLSQSYDMGTQLTPWSTHSWVLNQDLITNIRFVVAGNIRYQGYRQGLNFMAPLVEHWPNEPINAAFMAELYIKLQNFDKAEKWALVVVNTQPEEVYSGQHLLLRIYNLQRDQVKMREIYDQFRNEAEANLLLERRNLNVLHAVSVLLRDYQQTRFFYQTFTDNYQHNSVMETNMAIYFADIGAIEDAALHLERALSLNPNVPNATTFRNVIEQKSLDPIRNQLPILDMLQADQLDPLVRLFMLGGPDP